MFTSERLIQAMMMGKLDEAEFDVAMDIALAAERGMFCPVTGQVLDSTSAVAIQTYQSEDDQWKTEAVVVPSVVHDEDWPFKEQGLIENLGEKGVAWRLIDAADLWKKLS